MFQDNVYLNVLLIISNLVLLVLAGFAIPCMLQIRRVAKELTQTIEVINQGLPGIVQNLEQMSGHLNRQVQEVSLTIRKIQGTLGLLVGLEEILRRSTPLPLIRILNLSMAVAKGVRVFTAHLLAERPEKAAPQPDKGA